MPQQIRVQDLIREEAEKAGIPPELALAVAEQESGFNPGAINPKVVEGESGGAVGVFQFLPSTAKARGIDPRDPVQNIQGGVRYLRELLDRHQGDPAKVLAEYGGVVENTTYVPSVLAKLEKYLGPPTAALGSFETLPGEPPLIIRPQPPGGAAPPPPAPPAEAPGFLRRAAGAVAESLDPRTTEGRRNLAGAAGAAAGAGAMIAFPPSTAILGPSTLSLLGAVAGGAGGGMLAETGEQLIGTKPPSGTAIVTAGAQQGLYEVAGQGLVWPVKAIGRRLLTSPVGRAAHEGLRSARQATMDRLRSVLNAATETLSDIRISGRETVEQTAIDLGQRVGQPPSASAAGRAAVDVLQGPAAEARTIVGRQVDEAARAGPAVDVSPLKAEAQQIVDRIAKPETTFPRRIVEEPIEAAAQEAPGIGVGSRQILEQQAASGSAEAAAILRAAGGNAAELEAAQQAAQRELLKHPAMGVLRRILNADDIVPFHDAHLWKVELQDALRGTYDKATKRQVESMTQKVAGGLRGALAGHEPYNRATAAYQAIVPLYTKEYAARLRKVAQTAPEELIKMIKPNKPTAVRMLRDLLVQQSAEGGQPAQGQRAWDLVRSAWTHQQLLKDGVEGLDTALGKLTGPAEREFADIFYGDSAGQTVLRNLQTIASAYKAAQQSARGATRQAARDVRGARAAITGARKPTADELRFGTSTIAGRQPSLEELAAHGIRAFVLGPTQIWGGLSWLRLIRGPREKDLIEWAAYSPANTQRLVRLMTGPNPTGLAIADLLRSAGLLDARPPRSAAAGAGAQAAIPPQTGRGGGPGAVGAPRPQ
jgi:hypothetical protein